MRLFAVALFILTIIASIWLQLQVSAQPYKTLVAPIHKDSNTSLYTITLNSHEHYVIDLDAPFLWFICQKPHSPVACTSTQCLQARSYLSPLCFSNNTIKHGQCTCNVTPVNPVTKSCASAQFTTKDLIIAWANGRNPTVGINFNRLYVSCASVSLLQSLPREAIGLAGLSWSPLALSTQFTPSYLGLTKKFAICLPSTSRAKGVIFFGDGPYNISPPTNFDAVSVLSYTPLLINPNPKSPEYYIGLNTIALDAKASQFPPNAFDLDSQGHGGVKLSTVVPYITLRSDIYQIFIEDFKKLTNALTWVNPVKPFGLCVNSSEIGRTRVGLRVPQIDLMLRNNKNWTIFGVNSMKQVSSDVACLAFVDGGLMADQAVVIGSYQMEDNFLQFDLDQSRLGFSSSLFFFRTTCGNFNFTTST